MIKKKTIDDVHSLGNKKNNHIKQVFFPKDRETGDRSQRD